MEENNKLKSENILTLDEDFWNKRYQTNETGWDMKQVSPPLKSYVDTLTDKNLKILIPGCGNAYEAEYLLDNGFNNVTLVDISTILINRLKEKFKGKPIQIIHCDFFEHNVKYELILEQTFFCALVPLLRKNYVQKVFDLLKTKGKIAGVLFDKVFTVDQPPYIASKKEYKELFELFFNFNQFDRCKNSITPRSGNELFFEFEKKYING